MKIRIILYLLLTLSMISCKKEDQKDDAQQERSGVLEYNTGPVFQNKIVPVHYFIPKGAVSQMPVQIILHGADRNAKEYLAGWAQKAREYQIVIIAPEFSEADFNSAQYNEGNLISSNQLNPLEKTTFSIIDRIFELTKSNFDLATHSYNLYGHSAGAQFAHRMVQFFPSVYLDNAVAANAGWYTFPDETIGFPYGIKSLSTNFEAFKKSYFKKDLIILLGTADIHRDNGLRITQEADNQGLNRLERGETFYQYASESASSLLMTLKWRKLYAENIGHEHQKMSAVAADILYKE